jgi:hypothetical protein
MKAVPAAWQWGIDMSIKPGEGETPLEIHETNCGQGQSMCGGPKCSFNGKTIPCFVGVSPKASITPELLTGMLGAIDSNNVFPRNGPNDVPFLLLDGHQSRTTLEFLTYVVNPETKWKACFRVPYGTHIWQPADSYQW